MNEPVNDGDVGKPIEPGPVEPDSHAGRLILDGKLYKCPGSILEPGSLTQVKALCGNPTTEFLCEKCWKLISSYTRRAFNTERARLTKLKLTMSPLMRELIAQAITEVARNRP